MRLEVMELHLTPTDLTVHHGRARIRCARVVVDATLGDAPQVTVVPLDPVQGHVDGAVHVVAAPSQEEVDAAAVQLLRRVDVDDLARRCQVRLAAGARNPYQVMLEVLVEMADA